MQSNKPFLTYTQQIDKLKHEKNLVIANREYAEYMLKRISYYALISGYKKLFRNPTTRKYKDNTTFEEIVALYKFDGTIDTFIAQTSNVTKNELLHEMGFPESWKKVSSFKV